MGALGWAGWLLYTQELTSQLTPGKALVLRAAGCKDDSSSSAAQLQSRHPPGHTQASPGEHAKVSVCRDELGSKEILAHH